MNKIVLMRQIFYRNSKYLMPVLLCLALLFSQALGFRHAYDHAANRLGSSENIDLVSINFNKQVDSSLPTHNCAVMDAACASVFAKSQALDLELLDVTHYLRVQEALYVTNLGFYSYYSSRAPPRLI